MQCKDALGNIATYEGSPQKSWQYQEIDIYSPGCLHLHAAIGHGLPLDGNRFIQEASLSALRLDHNEPSEKGPGVVGTEQRRKVMEETNRTFDQLISRDGRLNWLNNVGVFCLAEASERTKRQLGEARNTTSELISDWINKGPLMGLRTGLFNPSFVSAFPGSPYARIYFDVEWRPFDPWNRVCRTGLEGWMADPGNRDKDNLWSDRMTKQIEAYTGLRIHSAFFKEKYYAGIILRYDTVSFHILIPEAVAHVKFVGQGALSPLDKFSESIDKRCKEDARAMMGGI
ncbi:uncharacterized protein PV07_12826 [Cladophialophora immunda]|uniref:Uncharacterized protein n=1 Tax=Cladophialophora immunda TaxID=569365 RepID=A0A0D2CDV6_9EURO|nr:uncharacterized protein PV07_12826 [Cladophialophora immunda]KIW21744.1 hypothetical protein PV07_12826 [Cladophialophora immunda]